MGALTCDASVLGEPPEQRYDGNGMLKRIDTSKPFSYEVVRGVEVVDTIKREKSERRN